MIPAGTKESHLGEAMMDEKLPYPLENLRLTSTDLASWLAERERRGGRRVEVGEIFDNAVVGFRFSVGSLIAESFVEVYECMAKAARSAVDAVEVLDRLNTEDDRHMEAALKRYVEDTGEALKQADDLLRKVHSGLDKLFPEIPLWKVSKVAAMWSPIESLLSTATGFVGRRIGTSGCLRTGCQTSTSSLRSSTSTRASVHVLLFAPITCADWHRHRRVRPVRRLSCWGVQ